MKKMAAVISMFMFFHLLTSGQDARVYDITESSGAVDTSAVIYSWTLDLSTRTAIPSTVDTVLDYFQISDPLQRNYVSYSTTGNYSQPSISNIFSERIDGSEFILANSYFPYMKLSGNTRYINTRKPFSVLSYQSGQSSQNKFEFLDAFHTQNISPRLNAGLNFTTAKSYGQYIFQRTRNNSLSVFGSYNGAFYTSYYNINLNKIVADENGGVLDDRLITDTIYSYTRDVPVLFSGIDNPPTHQPDVYNEVKNVSAFTYQEIALRRDSSSVGRTFLPTIGYIFNIDRFVRLFNDKDPSVGFENGLYNNVYVNNEKTADSLLYWKMYNGFRLRNRGSKYRVYADVGYEMLKYSMSSYSEDPVADTLLQHWFLSQEVKFPSIEYTARQYNALVAGGASFDLSGFASLDIYGKLFVTGYRHGDFIISGKASLLPDIFGKKGWVMTAGADIENKSPDFLFTHYASNNFIWTVNFNKMFVTDLSLNINNSSKKLDFSLNYQLFRGFIFLNDQAKPEQLNNNLKVMEISLSKEFNFWKITSSNAAVYQHINNDDILSLPTLSFVSSTWFKHMFNFKTTGGQLLTMAGFDLRYNTAYFANAYMPALSSFYIQREKKLGNYPYIDVFLNVRLKRFRFYIKFEHVNSGWIDRNYFTVLHYPMNERNLNFGMSWTFYD